MGNGVQNYQVYSPQEFHALFLNLVKQAKEKVLVQIMEMNTYGEYGQKLLAGLKEAADRGIDVRVNIDNVILLSEYKLPQILQQAGVKVTVIDPFGKNIFLKLTRHSHIKVVVVDKIAFLGGMNFKENSFQNTVDCMVLLANEVAVKELKKLILDFNEGRSYDIKSVDLGDGTRILFDNGDPGKSRILDEVISLVKNSTKSVNWLSEYIPDGQFLKEIIIAKKRGVRVCGLVAPLKSLTLPDRTYSFFNLIILKLKRLENIVKFGQKMIHGKLLLVDGKKAVVGSHNFADLGVRLGTKEAVLVSENPTLVGNLIKFYKDVQKVN